MYGSISVGLMNMTADVYSQENEQDEKTGAIVRRWVFKQNIECFVDIFSHSGSTSLENSKDFSDIYKEEAKYMLRTRIPLSKRFRLSNIKNRAGELLFMEQDQIDSPPTIFEIYSYHPRLDPFGHVMYYEANIRRVSVQSNV